jgi:inosine-uridine nucleoside N-ribohydrolase
MNNLFTGSIQKIITIIIMVIVNFLFSSNKTFSYDKPKIIFDTDIGNDIDDVLALQMLLNYHKHDKIDLLGVTICKANPATVEYLDGYLNFNNIEDIPIGYVYDGKKPEVGRYLKQTLNAVVDGNKVLHPKQTENDNIPNAYSLMREILAKSADQSVVLVTVGVLTNISRLLESEADEYSKLNGIELVKRKVKFMSVMGGHYGPNSFPEWNIKNDISSAQNVFSMSPVPIIASGWEVGKELLYPHQSIESDFSDPEKHPLCISYRAWGEMPYDRPSWDLTSVLIAVEPDKKYFNLSSSGIITIDKEGNSLFSIEPNGMHRYLIHNSSNTRNIIKTLVKAVTDK